MYRKKEKCFNNRKLFLDLKTTYMDTYMDIVGHGLLDCLSGWQPLAKHKRGLT